MAARLKYLCTLFNDRCHGNYRPPAQPAPAPPQLRAAAAPRVVGGSGAHRRREAADWPALPMLATARAWVGGAPPHATFLPRSSPPTKKRAPSSSHATRTTWPSAMSPARQCGCSEGMSCADHLVELQCGRNVSNRLGRRSNRSTQGGRPLSVRARMCLQRQHESRSATVRANRICGPHARSSKRRDGAMESPDQCGDACALC